MAFSPKILIVDDDSKVRTLVRTILEENGFKVIEAKDGLEGVSLANKERPNLIVSDIVMPNLDGIEALYRLKRTWTTRYIPVILLTSEDRVADKTEGFEEGADDYLTKPFSPGELVLRIKNVLKRSFLKLDKMSALPSYGPTQEELANALRDQIPFNLIFLEIRDMHELPKEKREEITGLLGEIGAKTISGMEKEYFAGRYDPIRYIVITRIRDMDSFSANLRNIFERVSNLLLKKYSLSTPEVIINSIDLGAQKVDDIYSLRKLVDKF